MRWRDLFRRRTSGGPITVAYEPRPDGRPDPGEVVWAWVPYEDDPKLGKDRPVLIIGRTGRQLVAVPLTSQDRTGRRAGRNWVPIGSGPWDRQARQSYANAERLLRYSVRQVRREGATLGRDAFDDVVDRARALHPAELV